MMSLRRWSRTAAVLALAVAGCAGQKLARNGNDAEEAAAASKRASGAGRALPAWIQRSDEHARLLLDVDAKFHPEHAAQMGVDGIDEQISDFSPGHRERARQATRAAQAALEARLAREEHPRVRDDIAILIRAADLRIRSSRIEEAHAVPYENVTEMVFGSVQALLDDRIAAARRPAALERVRRYAGLQKGYRPVAELVRAEILEKLDKPGAAAPYRRELEKHLATNGLLRDGITALFEKYRIADYAEPCRVLLEQLTAYDAFVRETLLPKARDTFVLPAPLYAIGLEGYGVDVPPATLARTGHAAFAEIQAQMQSIAASIATERKLPSPDYRDVIRALKAEHLVGEQILPHYHARLAEIEAILRREHLVTLPSRSALIRLGTPAESAASPAPHMRPPRLLGNTGEQGEFVLPLTVPTAPGAPEGAGKLDDFTFAAASWTLTAHEARPGHEMQFARLVEGGVSIARATYAFNSANVEGWGLYAEQIVFPHMPKEGQLISLQLRLQRAARAFVDPELQEGKWTFDSARAFLEREVGLSTAFATSEVERYTFRAPGQATSYFYGYTRLLDIRRELEAKLGARFDVQRFHDAILAQGLLPPALLRDALLRDLGG